MAGRTGSAGAANHGIILNVSVYLSDRTIGTAQRNFSPKSRGRSRWWGNRLSTPDLSSADSTEARDLPGLVVRRIKRKPRQCGFVPHLRFCTPRTEMDNLISQTPLRAG